MAAKLNWLMLCNGILIYFSHLCTCNFDTEEGNGVQPELRIFHHSCALKMDEGPCKALKERFYFDTDTRRCQRFEYGGCQGNANNFETVEECEMMCIVKPDKTPCHLDEEPGPCRGLVPRYFFSRSHGECQRFFYGGCFGNANNFRTREECEARCHQSQPDPAEPATDTATSERAEPPQEPEPAEPATDTATSERAEPPQVPGDVEQPVVVSVPEAPRPSTQPLISSVAHRPKFCLSPIDRGTCGESVQRYIYNPRKKRCQMFHYTGCGGNRNNFGSRRQCVRTCMKDQPGKSRIRVKKRNFNIIFRSV
ncbi:tissue factor pathway inhibitor a isoform X2 [Conger conger]|uniref:tissue factor pathway inhibitor a isoform X2 n=1 Tax=Conger conger TaxID=82655 RepID=UPI002A599C49|nr:tissue factor pathway inhibitor a isoform X2 [Conger conger]